MPNTVVLYNSQTGKPEPVPTDQADSLVKSGKYYQGSQTHVREGSGSEAPLSEANTRSTAGTTQVSGATEGYEARKTAHEERLKDSHYAVESFGWGLADAVTMGLIHPSSDRDKEIVGAHGVANFAGNIAGTVATLVAPGGGEAKLGELGAEAAGKAAMGGIVGEAKAASKLTNVAGAAIKEAAVGGALGSAHATGSAISDSIIDDKPMAIDSAAAEVGLGSLLGFGVGGLGKFLERSVPGVSRQAVKFQGGVLDPLSNESSALIGLTNKAHAELDQVLEKHSFHIGEMQSLADEGVYPKELVEYRQDALKAARKAQEKLDAIDPVAVNGDDAKYAKWKQASEDYQAAVKRLDDVSRPGMLDHKAAGNYTPVELQSEAVRANNLAQGEADAAEGLKIQDNIRKRDSDQGIPGMGVPNSDAMRTPENLKAYESHFGQPFEDPRSGFTQMGHTPSGSKPVVEASNGEENLGGQVTPTSADKTNPGKMAKGTPPPGDVIPVQSGGTVNLAPSDHPMAIHDPAEAAQSFVTAKTEALGVKPGQTVFEPTAKVEAKANYEQSVVDEGKAKLKEFVDNWAAKAKDMPRPDHMGQAEMAIHNLLFDLNAKMGGKLDTVAGTFDWRNAGSSLTGRIDQIRNLRKMSAWAADEARGVASPLRDMVKKEAEEGAKQGMARAALKLGANAAAGAIMGEELGKHGIAGALMGAALGVRYAGMAGKLASMAGKTAGAIRDASAQLLNSKAGTALASATRNIATNNAYQYSKDGPEPDALKRMEQVKELAANPEAITQQALGGMGDLGVVSPEIAQGVAQSAVAKLQTISMMVPAIYYTPTGQPIKPNAQDMRKFLECENAVHNPMDVVKCIGQGSASNTQLQALKMSAPAIYMGLTTEIMKNPDAIQRMAPIRRKMVERLIDQPMTHSSSPEAVFRSQISWQFHGQQQAAAQQSQGSPQALAIHGEQPTPSQAQSKAPGNQ